MADLIIDASVAIGWIHELGDLVVLEGLLDLGHDVILPEKVVEEIEGVSEFDLVDCCEVRASKRSTFEAVSARYFRLGSGEKAVISLGKECVSEGDEYLCVVDDLRAREACEAESLAYTGQIGLINLLIEAGSIDREVALRLLQKMEDEGAWLPPDWRMLVEGDE